MSPYRSRYGRHTEKLSNMYSPHININGSLCSVLKQIKSENNLDNQNTYLDISSDAEFLNSLIIDFYSKSLSLLSSSTNSKQLVKSEYSDASHFELNENRHLQATSTSTTSPSNPSYNACTISSFPSSLQSPQVESASHDKIMNNIDSKKRLLPKCVILLFCRLFDIKIQISANPKNTHHETTTTITCSNNSSSSPFKENSSNNQNYDHYESRNLDRSRAKFKQMYFEFSELIKFVETKILKNNKFCLTLKIGLFLKIIRILMEPTSTSTIDLYDKRISDLMKSEMALVDLNNENCNDVLDQQQQQQLRHHSLANIAGNAKLSADPFGVGGGGQTVVGSRFSLNDSLISCQSNLLILLSRINSLLFRHMNDDELNNFFFK